MEVLNGYKFHFSFLAFDIIIGGVLSFSEKINSMHKLFLLITFFLLPMFSYSQVSNIKVISPNGNEQLQVGTRQAISWVSNNIERVNIFYSIDNGRNWLKIADGIDAKLGTIGWKVPNFFGKNATIKITDSRKEDTYDLSDGKFTFSKKFSITGNLSKLSKPGSTIKIMPLGNSITYDNRVNDPRPIGDKAGYRKHLYELLNNANIDFSFVGSEHSGGNFLPAGYDNNAGFPGIRDSQLTNLLQTGWRRQPQHGIDEKITDGPYLNTYPADIILLHIGTNDNDKSDGTLAVDVKDILDHIDSISTDITVILARIIDRAPNKSYVSTFNDNIENMALDRVNNPSNDAYPDKIVIVDMQHDAGIDYAIDSMGTIEDGKVGDMNDQYHPNDKGYYKMAELWFSALSTIIYISPTIIEQPNNLSVFVGQSAQFKIKANGTKPLTYQWKKNGINIPGAIDSIYQIDSVQISDNEAHFSCAVSNIAGNIVSDEAVLSVLENNTRVKDGLLVLYTFEKDENNIPDISGVGSPLGLTIADQSKVKNVPYGKKVFSPTIISASGSPLKIFDSCKTSNEISIEAWIKPSNLTQTGPARIITFSKNGGERNFTLGQQNNKYIVRLSTTNTDANGIPALNSTGIVNTDLTHIVYTRSSNGQSKIYINGIENIAGNVGGNFSTWNSSFSFGLANEFTTDRNWLGTYYLIAVYNKALSSFEVGHNYNIGFNGMFRLLFPPTDLEAIVKSDSLVKLTWTDNCDNELGYIIERRANSIDSIYYVLDTTNANIESYTDYSTKHSTSYFYRIKAYNAKYISDYSDTIQVNNLVGVTKTNITENIFRLYQNYPNPFNPTTAIEYTIPIITSHLRFVASPLERGLRGVLVTLKVYDILGKEIATLVNKEQKAGTYRVTFDASNLSSGIYYYQLRAGSFVQTKKMILLQ